MKGTGHNIDKFSAKISIAINNDYLTMKTKLHNTYSKIHT